MIVTREMCNVSIALVVVADAVADAVVDVVDVYCKSCNNLTTSLLLLPLLLWFGLVFEVG